MANDKKDDRKAETPEDVAALYAWANLQNVKYRDFSANRREHRAQQQMQRPVVTRSEVTPIVKPPAPVAKPAPRRVPNLPGQLADPYRAPERKSLVDSKRPASFSELPLSQNTASRDSGGTRLNLDGEYSRAPVQERTSAPERVAAQEYVPMEESANVLRPANRTFATMPPGARVQMPTTAQPSAPIVTRTPVAARPVQATAPPSQSAPPVMEHFTENFTGHPASDPKNVSTQQTPAPGRPAAAPTADPVAIPAVAATAHSAGSWRYSDPVPEHIHAVAEAPAAAAPDDDFAAQQSDRPAWLYQEAPVRQAPVQSQPQSAAVTADTLTDTRERVASRWFALRGVFNASPEKPTQQELQTPVTAVFSLAGGVGKTSMVATLGRALSATGERVLLTDTTSYGLLPFYYGATELRPGTVRTFTPPPTTGGDSPVSMVSYDADAPAGENEQDWLLMEMANAGRTCNRVLVDLATASGAIAKRILRTTPTVIVPIVPDMNSVIGLSAVEQFFRSHRGGGGHLVQPSYVLNQFDPSQPLHLDVREVLRQQLGDRLLPIVLRRSQAVSEALAEGMTVIDYAPKSGIADDYAALANWLRNVQAPSQQTFRAMRWSEQ